MTKKQYAYYRQAKCVCDFCNQELDCFIGDVKIPIYQVGLFGRTPIHKDRYAAICSQCVKQLSSLT